MLCVANLSRFAQPVDLDLAGLGRHDAGGDAGLRAVSAHRTAAVSADAGAVRFPLAGTAPRSESVRRGFRSRVARRCCADSWETLLEGFGRSRIGSGRSAGLSAATTLVRRKGTAIRATRIVDWGELSPSAAVLALVEVQYQSRRSGQLPATAGDNVRGGRGRLRQDSPGLHFVSGGFAARARPAARRNAG